MAVVHEAERRVEQTIEEQRWLDRLADGVQRPIRSLMGQQPGLRSALDGTWLGHPVHAAVSDWPIGAWLTGFVLDLVDLLGINRKLRRGADAAHTIGLVGALTAAVFGLSDWSYTGGRARRVGFVHGVGNLIVASLYGASLAQRAKGNRGTGILLSSLGYGILLFTSWLGGELVYRFGIGVNRTAFESEPQEWVPVLDDRALGEGELRRVEANGTPVLLTRLNGQIFAIGDTCTHMGCSLSSGQRDHDVVTCPCHGSRFRLTDGEVVTGPAAVAEPRFDVRVQAGRIEVCQSQPAYGAASVGA